MTWRPHRSPSLPLPRPPAPKFYGWWRAKHGLPLHKKWRLVAAKTGLPQERVALLAISLLDHASQATPRGSLAEFSCEEYAAHFGIDPEHVARIYAELEALSWIEQTTIANWYEHQRDGDNRDADRNAEKQRRYRAKVKREREELLAIRESVTGNVGNVTGNETGVTTDKIRLKRRKSAAEIEESEASGALTPQQASKVIHSNSGDCGDEPGIFADAADPEVWLATEGHRIVKERLMTDDDGLPRRRIKAWRDKLGDDEAAIMSIADLIKSADRLDVVGARFHHHVADGVARIAAQAIGPELRLMKTIPGGKGAA